MAAQNNRQFAINTKVALVSSILDKSSVTQVRLRIHIPQRYQQEPIISRLTSEHGLMVNITGAMLTPNSNAQGKFDLELRGTANQICSGLAYMEALQLKILGKPNTHGDGWGY